MSSLAPACGALQLAAPQTASAAQVGGLLCFSALTPPVALGEKRVNTGAWAGVPEQVSPRPSSLPGAPRLSVAALPPRLAPDMKVPKGVKNPVFYGQQPEKKLPVSSGYEIKQTPVVLACSKVRAGP